MKLMKVRDGKWLHFPMDIDSSESPLWLSPGGVLDLDDPFTAKCVVGQEYKLVPAEDAAELTLINHARFNKLRGEFLGKVQVDPKPESTGAKETLAGIPKPDSRPRKGEEKKHGALSGSLPPSNS